MVSKLHLSNIPSYRDLETASIQRYMPQNTESHGVPLKKGMSGKSWRIFSLMNFIKGKDNLCYYANIGNSDFIMFINL